jgi:hypothetical protein
MWNLDQWSSGNDLHYMSSYKPYNNTLNKSKDKWRNVLCIWAVQYSLSIDCTTFVLYPSNLVIVESLGHSDMLLWPSLEDTYDMVVISFISGNMSQTTLHALNMLLWICADWLWVLVYVVLLSDVFHVCFRYVVWLNPSIGVLGLTHSYHSYARVHDSYYSSSCASKSVSICI